MQWSLSLLSAPPCWFKPAVINGPAKMLLTQIGAKKWRGKDAHMFFQFQFISDTILQRLATGTISIWGKVGEVDPSHLVMPRTVEPSKSRLYKDNRFVNLWMIDQPFNLDHLHQLPLYVSENSYRTVCDDYDHVLMASSSRMYFGFQWGGWFFTSNTISFGWKLSAYGLALYRPPCFPPFSFHEHSITPP